MLEAALDAAGLDRAVIGLGDADLYRQLLAELGVEGEARDSILERLAAHDLVGLEAELSRGRGDRRRAVRDLRRPLPAARRPRGARPRPASSAATAVERATARLRETFEALEARGAADRVQLDLGLLRDLGYYSGAILEVYDPALGHVLGGGGRYDELLGRFGVDLPAAGFALYLERVHVAQTRRSAARGVAPMSAEVAGDGPRQGRRAAEARGARGAPCSRARSTCSTRAGIDTAELRGDSRSLIFDGRRASPW